jgi:hypothetical protein
LGRQAADIRGALAAPAGLAEADAGRIGVVGFAAGDAAMQTADTVDDYTRRAAAPNSVNAVAVMSREHFPPFDVKAAAPRLAAPVMMVHSDRALSPHWARRFHDRLGVPKARARVESRGQTDFYDDPALIEPSAGSLARRLTDRTGARA